MSLESIDYREVGKDIYAKVRDGELTENEREDILSRYEEECWEIQEETCNNLQELQESIGIFEETLDMQKSDVQLLQKIIFSNSDGYFWPISFQKFLKYRDETWFSGGVVDLLSKYNEIKQVFTALSQEERKKLQPVWGKDGIFGRNTFKYILSGENTMQRREEAPQEQVRGEKEGIEENQVPEEERKEVSETIENIEREKIEDNKDEEEVPEENIEDIDGVLVDQNATDREARETFRSLFGKYIREIEDELWLPEGFIDSIVAVETTYGKNLRSGTGSKGLMQLTWSPFADMLQDKHRFAIYAPLFQNLYVEKLFSIEIDGKRVDERMPKEIVRAFTVLSQEWISFGEFKKQIRIIQEHLQWRGSWYDHEANLIIGAIYLSYQYKRHRGNIFRAARDYNGESGGGNIRYGHNVERRFDAYGRENGWDQEPFQSEKKWIENNVSPENLKKLLDFFEIEDEDIWKLIQAVRIFQKENGLGVDGKPGRNTLRKINEYLYGPKEVESSKEIKSPEWLLIRQDTPWSRKLTEFLEWPNRWEIQKMLERMNRSGEKFYPVLMGDSLIFMTNPTYAPDTNGDGVSSNEAIAYARSKNLLLPNRYQTDAARDQAQVRGNMPTRNNVWVSLETQKNNTASQKSMLEAIIASNRGKLVGWLTKVWAFNHGQQPGLNGAYKNASSGRVWQGYSTVHGPDYADYSQAAQFVYPLWINSAGKVQQREA